MQVSIRNTSHQQLRHPGEVYQVDCVTLDDDLKYGTPWTYLINLVDVCSCYCFSALLESKSSENVAGFISEVVRYRPCKAIQTDNGSEFVNRVVNRLIDDLNIVRIKIPPYSPYRQGKIEALNKTI